MKNFHEPVMLREVLDVLDPKPGDVFLDGTIGHGGHAFAFAKRLSPRGVLIGIDRDPEMLSIARGRLGEALPEAGLEIHLKVGSYAEAPSILQEVGRPGGADLILLDVGVNSLHLDDADRGFSFSKDGPLDGRFDRKGGGKTMADLVNTETEAELSRLLRLYGDEKLHRPIARRIVRRRAEKPLERTLELAEIASAVYPPKARYGAIHPATRMFQAFRIAINDELEVLRRGVAACLDALAVGGKLGVLSFQSGEHKIVKSLFREVSDPRPDPSNPYSATSSEGVMYRQLFRKAMACSPQEAERNPRARSTQFRAIERLGVAGA